MKNLVVILSVIFLANFAQAAESNLTCQTQERLAGLSDENLLHWSSYEKRYKSAASLEDRQFSYGYYYSLDPINARVGNCFVELYYNGIILSIESGKSHSLLEDEQFNSDMHSLQKAVRKAKIEEEKASASTKLKEAREENTQKIQKVIDSLRATLSNCEC